MSALSTIVGTGAACRLRAQCEDGQLEVAGCHRFKQGNGWLVTLSMLAEPLVSSTIFSGQFMPSEAQMMKDRIVDLLGQTEKFPEPKTLGERDAQKIVVKHILEQILRFVHSIEPVKESLSAIIRPVPDKYVHNYTNKIGFGLIMKDEALDDKDLPDDTIIGVALEPSHIRAMIDNWDDDESEWSDKWESHIAHRPNNSNRLSFDPFSSTNFPTNIANKKDRFWMKTLSGAGAEKLKSIQELRKGMYNWRQTELEEDLTEDSSRVCCLPCCGDSKADGRVKVNGEDNPIVEDKKSDHQAEFKKELFRNAFLDLYKLRDKLEFANWDQVEPDNIYLIQGFQRVVEEAIEDVKSHRLPSPSKWSTAGKYVLTAVASAMLTMGSGWLAQYAGWVPSDSFQG